METKEMVRIIHLQGVGSMPATEAQTLKIGDILVWNFGYTSTIIGIDKVTPKTIVFRTRTNDGQEYAKRMSKTRLVAKVND